MCDEKDPIRYLRCDQAIHWAIDCKVDIISAAFSFKDYEYEIDNAIRRAIERGIIVVVAASGMRGIRWIREVIAAYSADANGNASHFNPSPRYNEENFSFLGEDVESAWPVAFGEGPKKSLSGSSVATAVAAGIAALFLRFSRQESHLFQPNALRYLSTPEGMRKVFRYLSSGRGSHGYVTPWKLLSKRQSSARIVEILEDILGSAPFKRPKLKSITWSRWRGTGKRSSGFSDTLSKSARS